MSKERLEEIEARYSTLTIANERGGIEYIEVDIKDLVFLIQNGFKQAERVQGLEKGLGALIKQNKRYHEAIENIVNSDWWLIKPNPFCTIEEVYEYCVVEAQKAIKGEE